MIQASLRGTGLAPLTDIYCADALVRALFPKVDFDFVHPRVRGLSGPWRADPVEFMEYLRLEDGGQK